MDKFSKFLKKNERKGIMKNGKSRKNGRLSRSNAL
jgi:hypothetical protein